MGKLIIVYNPMTARAGSTTLAITIATILSEQHHVLLINGAKDRQLESYMQEVMIKSSVQQLDIFKDIVKDEVQLITTHFSDGLDVIGGGMYSGFSYLSKLKMQYDYIIMDLSNVFNQQLLAQADLLLPMLPFNRTLLEQYAKQCTLPQEVSVVHITVVPRLVKQERIFEAFNLKQYCMLPYDDMIYNQTNLYGRLFSCLKQGSSSAYLEQIKDLLANAFHITFDEQLRCGGFWSSLLFKKTLRRRGSVS